MFSCVQQGESGGRFHDIKVNHKPLYYINIWLTCYLGNKHISNKNNKMCSIYSLNNQL